MFGFFNSAPSKKGVLSGVLDDMLQACYKKSAFKLTDKNIKHILKGSENLYDRCAHNGLEKLVDMLVCRSVLSIRTNFLECLFALEGALDDSRYVDLALYKDTALICCKAILSAYIMALQAQEKGISKGEELRKNLDEGLAQAIVIYSSIT